METIETKETIAQEALRLLEPIPAEDWVTGKLADIVDGKLKGCALGWYLMKKDASIVDESRKHNPLTPGYWGKPAGIAMDEFASKSMDFLNKYHSSGLTSIANVNNEPSINGYTEPVIKDRVIHCLKDMVAAGY